MPALKKSLFLSLLFFIFYPLSVMPTERAPDNLSGRASVNPLKVGSPFLRTVSLIAKGAGQ